MKKSALALAFVLACAFAPDKAFGAEGIEGSELLGVRVGGVVGSPSLRDEFGGGSELELYFIEGLGPRWGLGLALSSHNFGASRDTLANIAYTGLNREVRLSIFSMTGFICATRPIGGRFTASGEAGLGLYSITAGIPAGFYEGTITENRFGLYGGGGLLFRISRGISLDVSVKYHYVFVGDDQFEPIYFFTGKTSAHFMQVALGVLLFSV